jgi:hypothetical protein
MQAQKEITKTPEQAMMDVLGGFWLSRAVYAIAKLGIADYIGSQPRLVDDIARDARVNASALYRVMRAVVTAGYFEEHPGRRFSHTPLSESLRSSVRGSMRATAMAAMAEDRYEAWGDIVDAVQTGHTAFDQRFGMPIWQYYQQHPEKSRVFEQSMSGVTERINEAIVSSYFFRGFRRALDIGGGEGALLQHVLNGNPEMEAVVFDRPEVIEMARKRIGHNPRLTLHAGDFFDGLPEGADLHMLKWILHDWDDERAVAILRNSRRSIVRDGRLLIMEMVLSPDNSGPFPKLMDLNMFVITGGRERTFEEYAVLLRQAGFRMKRAYATQSVVTILEAEPV